MSSCEELSQHVAEPRHMHSGVINDLRQAWCAEPCYRVQSGVCAGAKGG